MTRTIQIWMIITQFANYMEEICHLHPFLEHNCIVVKIFQKWMKTGPSFPSTFGSGPYMAFILLLAQCY